MKTFKHSSQDERQQNISSSLESRWQDLNRISNLLFPILFLVFLTTLYIIVRYPFAYMESWAAEVVDNRTYYVFLLRAMFLSVSPIMITVIGLFFILKQIDSFIRKFYQVTGNEKISNVIRNRLLGIPPLPPPFNKIVLYPFVIIKGPSLDKSHWACWLGGPATLVIFEGFAAYLERDNGFSRVVGPGLPMPFLDRHERIREIIDLRPQIRDHIIQVWTKDGIQLKLTVKAEYQIDTSSRSDKLILPAEQTAIKLAVESESLGGNTDNNFYKLSWTDITWEILTESISSRILNYSIGELMFSSKTNLGLKTSHEDYSVHFSQTISVKIIDTELENVKHALKNIGVKILNLQITSIELPKDILEICIKYLEHINQKKLAIRNGRIEADRIRARAEARAEAKRATLRTIIESLKETDKNYLTEQLLFSLSSILDQGLEDPVVRPWVTNEIFIILERIQKLLDDRV